jgi:hypothetical protein
VAIEKANELEEMKQRTEQADNLLNQTENENQKLKELIEKCLRAKVEQKKLN